MTSRAAMSRVLAGLLLGGVLVAAVEASRPYLDAVPLPDMMRILPPPPAPGSPRNVADRAIFRATRAVQGSERWAVATRDVTDDSFTTFACASGMLLDAKVAPATARVFARIGSGVLIDPVKQGYATRRPYLDDDRPICEPKTAHLAGNGDYPSGHTTNGWSTALLLAETVCPTARPRSSRAAANMARAATFAARTARVRSRRAICRDRCWSRRCMPRPNSAATWTPHAPSSPRCAAPHRRRRLPYARRRRECFDERRCVLAHGIIGGIEGATRSLTESVSAVGEALAGAACRRSSRDRG